MEGFSGIGVNEVERLSYKRLILQEFNFLPNFAYDEKIMKSLKKLELKNQSITIESLAAECLLSMIWECSCLTQAQLTFDPCQEAIIYLWRSIDTYSTNCQIVLRLVEYKRFEGRFPDENELVLYHQNRRQMQTDRLAYCLENSVVSTTPNLDTLEVQFCTENSFCTLCSEEIGLNSGVYILPCCGSTFHSLPEKCLGKTVIDWLERSTRCPNCRQQVILENKK
jgi:hypothetical protein